MNYDRLPVIGGLLEMTKSKKGTAIIATVIIMFGGSAFGIQHDILFLVAGLAVSYITGQTIIDARNTVTTITDAFQDEVESILKAPEAPPADNA